MTKEAHKKLGVTYFNKTWAFIDKQDKNKDEELQMLDYAHASKLHWQLSGAPVLNIVRGEWLIARVYAELDLFESSLLHAQRCADLTIQNDIDDFDLVFAYEGLARSHLINKNREEVDKYLDLAYKANEKVKKEEDREYGRSQLDEIKSRER